MPTKLAHYNLPPNWQQTALELAQKGAPVKTIAAALGIERYQLWNLRKEYEDFGNAFNDARKSAAESIADDLLTAHTDIADVMKARLFSDNARWVLARRVPEVYGDKQTVDMNVSGQIDLAAAIAQGNQRLMSDSARRTIDVTPVESSTYQDENCDNQSQMPPALPSIDDLLS